MRTRDEYRAILTLWEQRRSQRQIADDLKLPRSTVRDCIARYGSLQDFEARLADAIDHSLLSRLRAVRSSETVMLHTSYVYILGLYLGDGNITRNRQIYRLRITLDSRYPQIIEEAMQALQTLFPGKRVGVIHRSKDGKATCDEVSSFFRDWPSLLPQHGNGVKHFRAIELEPWQRHLVTAYPLPFFRGLYHSDGSRFDNLVNGRAYARYQFTNTSRDIIRLYCDTCDQLNLHWTSRRRTNRSGSESIDILISRRRDVSYLDQHIGPKQ